jgi:phosphoribosylformylglycinamidine cyclo-ligase
MFNTYNMGVGMTVTVAEQDADKAIRTLHTNGCDAYVIGRIKEGGDKVVLC